MIHHYILKKTIKILKSFLKLYLFYSFCVFFSKAGHLLYAKKNNTIILTIDININNERAPENPALEKIFQKGKIINIIGISIKNNKTISGNPIDPSIIINSYNILIKKMNFSSLISSKLSFWYRTYK